MSDYWLQCTTSEGLFPNELAVFTNTADGDPVSFFVDKAFIKDPDQEGPNSIRVRAINAKDNQYYVILPADPFESSSNIVVKSEQINQTI
ncbi:MAG: hypothetical protein JXR73_00230 [Candidatus Omnitrophica bacterium]|nr:hypothetical protein [Candidatus Omnitrophota bacterium]